MNNIEKLIASTKINHAGTEATETKLEAMARVIEASLHKDGKRYWFNDCNQCKIERCYPTLEQFQQEWEEMK